MRHSTAARSSAGTTASMRALSASTSALSTATRLRSLSASAERSRASRSFSAWRSLSRRSSIVWISARRVELHQALALLHVGAVVDHPADLQLALAAARCREREGAHGPQLTRQQEHVLDRPSTATRSSLRLSPLSATPLWQAESPSSASPSTAADAH